MNQETIKQSEAGPSFSFPIEFAWKKKRNITYSILKNFDTNIHLLDIGCNTGAELIQYSKFLDGEFIGLDRENLFTRFKKIEFILGDARFLPFKDCSFNIVTSTEVIEHFLEGESFIREVYRILKKNGIFVLTTPNRDRFSALPRTLLSKMKRNPIVSGPNDDHPREYSPHELRSIMEQNGFTLLSLQFIGFNPYLKIPASLYVALDKITDKYFARFTKWDMVLVAEK